MESHTVLGLIAGAFTTMAFVPQLHKAWISKSTKDVSLAMFSLFTLGVVLWFVYGILRNDIAVILWNGVTIVLAGIILILKLKYR
jgi:MtN3 and saliva related transmembrane protein